MKKRVNKLIVAGVTLGIIFLVGVAPFYMKTQSYPIAIVEGNSMYPNLQNGDMVIFHGVADPNTIANGTIIVFVQSESGVSLLDTLTKPTVIHRVIGTVVQAGGTVYYQTKGDNNGLPDPQLTQANHVLGTPVTVIPKVGIFFIFIQSPQGLVASVGFITLLYLSSYESKAAESKKKEKLLSSLSRKVLQGGMSSDEFKKLEIAVNYPESSEEKNLVDLRPIIKKVKASGWNVKVPASVEGRSGTLHEFDLAIFSKYRPEQPVVAVDIDASDESQSNISIIGMFAKCFDTGALNPIVISTHEYDDNMKSIAESYNILTIDGAKPSQISNLLLGAVTAILEQNKALNQPEILQRAVKENILKKCLNFRKRREA